MNHLQRPSSIRCLGLGLVLVLAASSLGAAEAGDLASIIGRHQSGAPDAAMELGLVDELEELAKGDAKQWLPDFWSAYFLTQIVMSHPEQQAERLARSHKLLDRAFKRAEKAADVPMGDLYALRSLIFTFELGGAESDQAYEAIIARRESVLTQAYESTPESPVVLVMIATNLIRSAQEEKQWPGILAGRATLQRAADLFEEAAAAGEVTTHFNREWVNPWLGWTDKMVEGGFDSR